jgi:hypothetical protein
MIDHNTRRVLFLLLYFFILALVPRRSQEIALRRSYYDYCSCFCFIIRVLFLSVVLPFVVLVLDMSQVITLREAIMMVA